MRQSILEGKTTIQQEEAQMSISRNDLKVIGEMTTQVLVSKNPSTVQSPKIVIAPEIAIDGKIVTPSQAAINFRQRIDAVYIDLLQNPTREPELVVLALNEILQTQIDNLKD